MTLNYKFLHKFPPTAYLFLLSTLIFLPTLNYSFTYDDIRLVLVNNYITSELGLLDILKIFTLPTHPGDLYRPLTVLSIKLNFLMSGLDPISYHATNILLHSLATTVIYKFILLLTKNCKLSFYSSLIFLIHPIHIEAIANIYNRSEILVAIFGLLALICFYRLLEIPTLTNYLLYPIFLFLAFLAKESALTLVGVCPLIYFFYTKKNYSPKTKTLIYSSLITIVTVIAYLIIRMLILGTKFLIYVPNQGYFIENPLLHQDFISRIFPASYLLGEYLRLIILPLKLSADYSLPHKYFLDILSSWPGYSAMLLALIFIFFTAFFAYRKSVLVFWALWLLVTFSLTINLLTPIGTFMADRLAYVPSIGLIVLIASLILKLPKYRTYFSVLYILLLLFHTNVRLPIWKNNITLFRQTMDDNSVSPKIPHNLGTEFYLIEEYQKSILFYKEAIFRDPTYSFPVKGIIYNYLKLGDWKRFKYWTDKYLIFHPGDQEILDLQAKFNQALQSNVSPQVSNKLPE